MGLATLGRRFFQRDRLKVTDHRGRTTEIGAGPAGSSRVHVRLTRPGVVAALLLNAPMALGEVYMDGGLVVEEGSLYDFLALVGANFRFEPGRGPHSRVAHAAASTVHALTEWNDRRSARRNVQHHYDLSADFYRLFLDPDLQYSCAYFPAPTASLEEAQALKKARLGRKLLLRPGMSVLDIGCGWGGLGLTLAQDFGARVRGVTLSTEQQGVAAARAVETGLTEQARFDLIDYRDVDGAYDRVISVGMFEHVGRPNYDTYFRRIAELLKTDGVAVIHSIGRMDGPGGTNPWTAKYIFPGGYVPALSEVLPSIERAGLWVTDVEILRLHYAETLKAWRERFLTRRDEAKAMYDERFCRMWEYYLVTSEIAFRYAGHMVFQIQLAKQQAAVPLTRRYLAEEGSATG